jgi:hypothetical protein
VGCDLDPKARSSRISNQAVRLVTDGLLFVADYSSFGFLAVSNSRASGAGSNFGVKLNDYFL